MRKRGEVMAIVRAGMAEGLAPKAIAVRAGLRVEQVYTCMNRLRADAPLVRLPADVMAQLRADPQRPASVTPADWAIAVLRDALPQLLKGEADG